MVPSSYQAPNRGDKANTKKTVSQSADSNLATSEASVAELISNKGDQVVSVSPNDTIATVVEILAEKKIGAVLVMDNNRLAGILSERDIVRKMAQTPGQTLPQQAQDLMTTNVETCSPSDALVTILQRMTEGRFRHMPVINSNGGIAGVISIGDVVNYRLNDLEYQALQMRQMIVG